MATEDGGFTAICEVAVDFIPVEKLQLDKSELKSVVGDTRWLTLIVEPENAANKKSNLNYI